LGGLKGDQLLIGGVIIALSYSGALARKIRNFLLPVLLTAIVYDSKRFIANQIRARIRVEEPYLFDQKFFGITTERGILTPNEWWQLHTHPLLDVICGVYYLAFIAAFVLLSAYFLFYRKLTQATHMMWSFFWVNVIGYSTYFWYPAAPPWYVSIYGLGPAILGTKPSAAGALRFDQLFNVTIFERMYSKGADVFGAIPSLHCAYPAIAVYWTFRLKRGRTFAMIYWIGMCFSAVYLNHHYIIDAIWGSAYAFIGSYAVERYVARKQPSPEPVLHASLS